MQTSKLTTPLGKKVKLTKIASVIETGVAGRGADADGAQYATVSGHITARDSGTVISAVKDELAAIKLPAGVPSRSPATAEKMNESFTSARYRHAHRHRRGLPRHGHRVR